MSDSTSPKWLSQTQVRMLHAESLQLFGGSPGIRDETLLKSALDRPKNKWHYNTSLDLFELAAAYGFGIAKNHAFIDGNKRTSLLAIRTFLFVNDYLFVPKETETVTMIEGLAAGTVDEEMLTAWIKDNTSPR